MLTLMPGVELRNIFPEHRCCHQACEQIWAATGDNSLAHAGTSRENIHGAIAVRGAIITLARYNATVGSMVVSA